VPIDHDKGRLMQEQEWLSLREAADALGISEVSARRWVKSGKLAAAQPGRRYLIPRSAVEELLSPKEAASSESGPQHLREWLASQGHMSRDRFRTYVEGLDLDIDEEGRPRGLERAIEELRQTRDRLIAELKKPAIMKALFPRRRDLPTRKEGLREALRPAGEAWKFEWELREEYAARERALLSYGRKLHAAGITRDHLTYAHMVEYERRLLAEALHEAGAA
jgi:excisionase family DNA binding protein